MAHVFYPAVLFEPDDTGWWGVTVPGINVNAQGESREAALTEAAVILQEVIDDLTAAGRDVPEPGTLDDPDYDEGTAVMLHAAKPELAA
ncbi:hypothetical protein [Jannaschia sp. LMIT008]|uniref:type II toxin-antitoxin system HicB family antitoxin n=1 Tax=Jannaschia maritima TaxID=3032585 RepID=UPI00281186CB|nr:hypothetical protein [Jannaschia sp. LMIT008]